MSDVHSPDAAPIESADHNDTVKAAENGHKEDAKKGGRNKDTGGHGGSKEATKDDQNKDGGEDDVEEDAPVPQADGESDSQAGKDDDDDQSDKDSDLLSEIDEDELEGLGSTAEHALVTIDEDIAKTLKASKRKPADGETARKPKEGRREKKRHREDDGSVDGQEDEEVTRPRKSRRGEGSKKTGAQAVADMMAEAAARKDDETLTPQERRRAALDYAVALALQKPKSNRRKTKQATENLENELDEQVANLKLRMEKACSSDNNARDRGQPAVHKLKLLPEVTAMLKSSAAQGFILDADNDFFLAVKFFLEPLNDGSLPAYNIQREIFTALMNLPIDTDLLRSSGLGKIVLFYTKSKKPEPSIKRMAERLVGEWSRPILKRTDDFKKRQIETREFDPLAAKLAQHQASAARSQFTLTQRPADYSRGDDSPTVNRAQPPGLPATYTIAPRVTRENVLKGGARPLGAGGIEAFRRITQNRKNRGQ